MGKLYDFSTAPPTPDYEQVAQFIRSQAPKQEILLQQLNEQMQVENETVESAAYEFGRQAKQQGRELHAANRAFLSEYMTQKSMIALLQRRCDLVKELQSIPGLEPLLSNYVADVIGKGDYMQALAKGYAEA